MLGKLLSILNIYFLSR